MGGSKGSSGGKSHDYYGTIAGLICAGPVQALVAIIADGKTVWPDANKGDWSPGSVYAIGDKVRSLGRVWTATSAHTGSSVNAPSLSGHWVESVLERTAVGVTNPQPVSVVGYGAALLYWGTADQVHTGAVPSEISGTHPPYRRQAWVLLKDWLFGRERVSAPNVEFVSAGNPTRHCSAVRRRSSMGTGRPVSWGSWPRSSRTRCSASAGRNWRTPPPGKPWPIPSPPIPV